MKSERRLMQSMRASLLFLQNVWNWLHWSLRTKKQIICRYMSKRNRQCAYSPIKYTKSMQILRHAMIYIGTLLTLVKFYLKLFSIFCLFVFVTVHNHPRLKNHYSLSGLIIRTYYFLLCLLHCLFNSHSMEHICCEPSSRLFIIYKCTNYYSRQSTFW